MSDNIEFTIMNLRDLVFKGEITVNPHEKVYQKIQKKIIM